MIVADDGMRSHALGCFSHEEVEGVILAFCSMPKVKMVCSDNPRKIFMADVQQQPFKVPFSQVTAPLLYNGKRRLASISVLPSKHGGINLTVAQRTKSLTLMQLLV